MPTTKSQSPGPNPSTSQPKQARSRKAATPAEQNVSGRVGSAGGIVLNATRKTSPAPKPATTASTTTAVDSASGPNRQRRRPRKLNKEPTSGSAAANTSSATTAATPASPAEVELEALKSRVRGLEAKVEELYISTETRNGRSPRRRGKGRKGSSATQVPTLSSTAARIDDEEEGADEELVRLEDELETARRDLEIYKPHTRPRTKRSTSGDSDYIEEIPRDGNDTVAGRDRRVTLSGNYRIPLPANLDMKDVQKIQSGVSAAQNMAKSFLEQRRATQAAQVTTPPAAAASSSRPKAVVRKTSSPPSMETRPERKSWGEWIGGYSMAISRAVKNIESEAAIESQRVGRTAAPKRSASMASKSTSMTGGAKRPGMKGRQGNLSSDQVHGLMK
ncbi:hypothetical protein P280DRAFT_464651 [Massarina eburnea CBS 473.64]|uniref:Uncharacterized protein n=1 Tax=Massarina eburnea CBS 473.64 TaxID=1395130 RepID=A0A6A6SF80_9PLEO|nr:hypothetical protein P280DRAFT_464651 [Massarina eburnea CBS 473.64]